jgi:hypothetical protein
MAIDKNTGTRTFQTYPAWRRYARQTYGAVGIAFQGRPEDDAGVTAAKPGFVVGRFVKGSGYVLGPEAAAVQNSITAPNGWTEVESGVETETVETTETADAETNAEVELDDNAVEALGISTDEAFTGAASVPPQTEPKNRFVRMVKNGNWSTRFSLPLCAKCLEYFATLVEYKVVEIMDTVNDCQSATCRLKQLRRQDK